MYIKLILNAKNYRDIEGSINISVNREFKLNMLFNKCHYKIIPFAQSAFVV